jgi:hypothetical protein
MATRLNNRHQESVKAKIQASQLINRVQKHALGELELTPTQLDANKFLINKIISNAPTEQYTELAGEIGIREIKRVIIDSADDTDSESI